MHKQNKTNTEVFSSGGPFLAFLGCCWGHHTTAYVFHQQPKKKANKKANRVNNTDYGSRATENPPSTSTSPTSTIHILLLLHHHHPTLPYHTRNMPNDSGFGGVGDTDLARILGRPSSSQSPRANRREPTTRSPGSTPSLDVSNIPLRRSSSTLGDGENDIGQPYGSPRNTETAAGSNSAGLLAALRMEEEASDRRAAEREARRAQDKKNAEDRKARLIEEQRVRREERRKEEEEGDVAEDSSPRQTDVQGGGVPGSAVTSSSSMSKDDPMSSLPSISDYTQSQYSPLMQQVARQPAQIAPPVIKEVPVVLPCSECPAQKTRIEVLETQLDAERAAAEAEKIEAVKPLHDKVHHLERVNEGLSSTNEQLRIQNEVLQAKVQGRSLRGEIATGALETVSMNDMIELRKEITHQDALIQQYQFEDEKNTLEVRTLRQQVTELQKQLIAMQKKSPSPPSPSQSQNDSANTSAIEATRVVKDLHRENARLKDQLRIKDEEHELQLNSIRKGKKTVEDKLQAVDWQRADDDAVEISNLRLELKKQRSAFEERLFEAEDKLEWYIKNQDILTKQDALVEKQGTEIEALKSRVVALDTTHYKKPTGNSASRIDKSRYIQELQQKVKGLEEIIRSKYPNSLPELIRACKPTETEVDMYRAMHERIAHLSQELSEREEEYEKGIRELRQETDKTLLEYKERHNVLKEEFKMKVKSATSQRIKELERKVEDTRAYYLKKVKELEAQVIDLRKVTKKHTAVKPTVQQQQHPRRTTSMQTDDLPQPTHYPIQQPQPPPYQAAYPIAPIAIPSGSNAAELVYFTGEISKLRGEVETSKREEREATKQADAAERELASARTELCVTEKAKRMQEAEAARLRETLAKERRERVEEVGAVNGRWRTELDDERRHHGEEVKALSRIAEEEKNDNRTANMSQPQRVDYIASVRRKMAAVDSEYSMRIVEMKRSLDEARRVAAFNLDVQKQKMDLIIQAKNNEIERFRISIDSLLEELNTLRQRQHTGDHRSVSVTTA